MFVLFIYLCLTALGLRCCVQAFSSCSEWGLLFCCNTWASHYSGFSCCRAQALGMWASVIEACRLSSCASWALEDRLSSCGTRAEFLHGMWDLPGPGIEPMSSALAGRSLTTVPSGKPKHNVLCQEKIIFCGYFQFLTVFIFLHKFFHILEFLMR